MEAQEIRMRCLEAAQASTKTVGAVAPPDAIIARAREFETFVVGDLTPLPVPTTKTKKAAAE